MRGLLIIMGSAALAAAITLLLERVTGDRPSAVMLELMAFITVASFFAGAPRGARPARSTVQGD